MDLGAHFNRKHSDESIVAFSLFISHFGLDFFWYN
jgi:hypothetical protein